MAPAGAALTWDPDLDKHAPAMHAVPSFGFMLMALLTPSIAAAQGAPSPPAPSPSPPATPEPATPTEASPPAAEAPPAAEGAPAASAPPAAASESANVAPLEERRPGSGLVLGAQVPAAKPLVTNPYERDFAALPLSLELRFGFNARLGSSFGPPAEEELLDTDFAVGAFLAWKPEFALGLELEHAGLGRVRALTDQNSIDAEYSATGAWLAARVFPLRRERLDFFVNLRIGLILQHVDALGTRAESTSISEPAASFSCTKWDGPGLGLGGALGLAYRLSRRVSVLSRLDATAARLEAGTLGTCADGIGSETSLSGSVGLAYEFETAAK